MLTGQGNSVDGWVTLSELARIKGVSKQALTKRAHRFVEAGRLTLKDGQRGTKLVNPAAYDVAANEIGDSIRALAQEPPAPLTPLAEIDGQAIILAQEQARKARYAADLAEIELLKARKQVFMIEDVTRAMERCAEKIVRALNDVPSRAGDVCAAVAREGENGARAFLKAEMTRLRQVLADEMRILEHEDDDKGQSCE